MLNANILVERFLTHSIWIRWVNTTPTSMIDHCFNSSSWHKWIKFIEINWNWSLLPMTFLISLSSIFNSIIGLNTFGEL